MLTVLSWWALNRGGCLFEAWQLLNFNNFQPDIFIFNKTNKKEQDFSITGVSVQQKTTEITVSDKIYQTKGRNNFFKMIIILPAIFIQLFKGYSFV